MKLVTIVALLTLASPVFAQTKPATKPQQPVQVQSTPAGKPFFSVLDTYDQKTGEPIPVIIANFPKAPNQLLIQNGQGDAVVNCEMNNSALVACTLGPKHTLVEAVNILLQAYQFTGPGATKQ